MTRFLFIVLCGFATTAFAAPPKLNELGVDQVVVKSGTRYLGAVLQKRPDGSLTIAVRREWLTTRSKPVIAEQSRLEKEAALAALKTLTQRLVKWQQDRPADEPRNKGLAAFLSTEADRIEMQKAAWEAGDETVRPRFLLVDVPRVKIDSVVFQPAARKQIALLAWAEDLPDVENRSVHSLTRGLKDRGVDLARRVNLGAHLPPRADDERQWAARQAVLEYRLRDSLAFQGTADKLFRTDEAQAAPDVGQLFGDLLKSQLESQLADLLGDARPRPAASKEDKALAEAQATADKAQASGFRATRLSLSLGNASGTVEGRFLARTRDGKWFTAWQTVETIDATKAQPDVEKELGESEQVKQVLTLARSTGLGADDQIRQALRFGAATKTAQETVDRRFQEFFSTYSDRVDSPPLWLPTMP